MRTIKYYFSFLVLFSVLFSSCSKEDNAVAGDTAEDVATLTFGAVLNDMMKKSALKQAEELPECSEDDPAYALVTVTYGDTEVDVEVDILVDDDGFFTAYHDDLEIPVTSGNTVDISLTDFRVFDEDDDLIWLAPQDDSDYENHVADALPMAIELRAGTKNYVDVEVLCFDDRVVNRYGYQFFDLLPETVYELCLFVNYCTDSGRHFTADYNLDLYYYRGDDGEGEPILDDLVTGESPAQQGTAGNWYTDPLCVAVPTPQMGEDADDPYLYYEVTLEEWDNNYPYPGALVQTGYLSWNDIAGYLDTDNDGNIDDNSDVDYLHLQVNCGDTPTPPPSEECDIEGPDNDCVEVYLNGQDDWVQISEAGDYYLIVENTESVYGEVNVTLVDGDPVFEFYSEEGYRLDDYVVEISEFGNATEGQLACVSAEDITLEEGDADAEVAFTSDLDYPFYARIKANLCEVGGEEPLELPDLAGGCEHAFMLETEDDDGFYTGGDWGWAEYISADDAAGPPIIYALLANGEDIGDVTIEVDGDDVTVDTQLIQAANVYLNNMNINISATPPGEMLPEQYDYNYVTIEDFSLDDTFENVDTDDNGGFWIIVHAEVCPTVQ